MNYLEKLLLCYLWDGQLEMKLVGVDMDELKKAVHEEGKRRLDMIEYIAFEDDDIISDAEKIASIKQLFQREFYSED